MVLGWATFVCVSPYAASDRVPILAYIVRPGQLLFSMTKEQLEDWHKGNASLTFAQVTITYKARRQNYPIKA